ncbi:tetratricopeptide repeat-containing sensor histidine kinase [Flavobacterium franklandianum]|uniref:histidine kinase n=1 Tax=Flavobacterium franklandianum TaxID=2594430 RepID=A0A553C5Z8_9FLAO|nr:ATP-binding protein [Flavobacterium franklandianum]TRX15928.1 ATP-binding protein [Flavobacterium franklandianum]
MIIKKLHSPILVLLTLFLLLQSCEKKSINNPNKKSNIAEIDRLIDLGDKHFENVKYDSAYYYHSKAKSLCDAKTDNTRILYSLARMSEIQQNQGDYTGSETTAIEAIPYLKTSCAPSYECSIYNLLGIVYMKLYDYDNALYYYNKGLNLKIDTIRKLKFKHNIAVVYMAKQDYNRAIEILLSLASRKDIINDPASFSKVIDNLGYSYFKMGNPIGIDYMNQALKLKKQIKGDWGLASSYLNLTKYYRESNPRLANYYAKLAYEKATKANNVDDRLESIALLIQSSTGNESKFYSEKYIHINDSITKVRQNARNQFAKIKYDSKKEKEENQYLKTQKALSALELEIQKNRNLFLCFLIVIGSLSTIFLYYFLKAVNKKEKIQTSYETETRIAKKLHDELANDVYHTMAFVETQDLSSSQNKEILLTNLDTIYSRTRNISKENSTIDTGLHFVAGLKEMMSSFNTDAVTILINGMDSVNWNALETNKKIIVYRVLQELLVNMKKHSQCSLAAITFKKNKNKLQIDYSDNGLGAASDKISSRNGLQNVENRILVIKGTITFDTKPGKGFKSSFTIPI